MLPCFEHRVIDELHRQLVPRKCLCFFERRGVLDFRNKSDLGHKNKAHVPIELEESYESL